MHQVKIKISFQIAQTWHLSEVIPMDVDIDGTLI